MILNGNLYTHERKETPYWKFRKYKGGEWLSPRQALQFISEEVVKPNMGKDYFGVSASMFIKNGSVNIFTVGFIEEVLPIQEIVGEDNIYKVVIERDGYTFDNNDTRNSLPDIMFKESFTITNNSDIRSLEMKASEIMEFILSINNVEPL